MLNELDTCLGKSIGTRDEREAEEVKRGSPLSEQSTLDSISGPGLSSAQSL